MPWTSWFALFSLLAWPQLQTINSSSLRRKRATRTSTSDMRPSIRAPSICDALTCLLTLLWTLTLVVVIASGLNNRQQRRRDCVPCRNITVENLCVELCVRQSDVLYINRMHGTVLGCKKKVRVRSRVICKHTQIIAHLQHEGGCTIYIC